MIFCILIVFAYLKVMPSVHQKLREYGSHSGISEFFTLYEQLTWKHRAWSYCFNNIDRNKHQQKADTL